MKYNVICLLFGFAFWISCRNDQPTSNPVSCYPSQDYLIQAVLWYEHSGEMRACYYQAYNVARRMLDINLAESKSDSNAVIMDIDETILNNSPYEGNIIRSGDDQGKTGMECWFNRGCDTPLPGALDFLNYVNSKKVRVFYITNRAEAQKEGTLKNLRDKHFPDALASHLLCRTEESGSKESRRRQVSEHYNILLLCGDNLGDLSKDFDNRELCPCTDKENHMAENDGCLQNVDKNKELFGTRYIILPNPMYGDWQLAYYKKWKLSEGQKDSIRRKSVIGN